MTAANDVSGTDDWVTLQAMIDATGLSYRQLDHWTRQGYLIPAKAASGTGSRRVWTKGELAIAVKMASLTESGFVPEVAANIARNDITLLAGGYRLVQEPEGTE